MTQVHAVAYEERQIGDIVVVVTRERIPIPAGWTDISWNRDTNPQIMAWHIVTSVASDVLQVWNVDRNTIYVAVMRGCSSPPPVGNQPKERRNQ